MQCHRYAAALLLPVLITACSDPGPATTTTPTPGGAHEHVSGFNDGYWPPQPTNTSNVELLPSSALRGAQDSVLDAAQQTVLTNPLIRNLLGSNSRLFSATLSDKKADDTASFTFYNYDTDQTIIASLLPDGSVQSEVLAAEEYQPPEHAEEAELAVGMAQTALAEAGFDLAELIGTALLAFPPAAEVSQLQQHFYPQRMIYVTFGPGNGALPVYYALVNLSTAAVVESGLVR